MNYFGLFFTFVLPFLILAIVAVCVFSADRKTRTAKSNAKKPQKAPAAQLCFYEPSKPKLVAHSANPEMKRAA